MADVKAGLKPLLMIMPTRSRPDRALIAAQSFVNTQSGEAELLVIVDDDDHKKDEYIAKLKGLENVTVEVKSRLRIGPCLNRTVIDHPAREFYGFMGDDHVYRTKDWDKLFIDTIKYEGNGWGFAYGNDLLQGQNLPTHVVVSSNIVRTLGYFSPPGLIHLRIDNAWKQIGLAIRSLFYLDSVIVEHMHPFKNKATMDDLYKEVNSKQMIDTDGQTFNKWFESQFHRDIVKLQDAMEHED